ncbi:MAG: acyl carrier protein [Actinobacteria bacterium]|nr:acyl carrier protein [Actinomycetota bacterium]
MASGVWEVPPTDLDQGPSSRQQVLELIRERLAEILEIEPATISEGASFTDDLDADSLALIELVEALETDLSTQSAPFRIEDEDLEDLKTVRDAVDYVVGRVGEASAP